MDDERIVRRVKPVLAISTTVSIKRWVEAEARRQDTSQAAIVNGLLLREMARDDARLIDEDDLVELAS